MFIGLFSRIAAVGTAIVVNAIVFYFGHKLGNGAWTHHHTTVLAFFLAWFALAPCGRSLSVDRWLALARAKKLGLLPPPERGPIWTLRLVSLQVAAVYFWTAFDKLNPAFAGGVKMEEYWLTYYAAELPESPLFRVAALGASWATIGLEFALAVGLFVARTRRYLFPIGIALHGIFYVMLPVSTYSVTFWVAYLAFLDPDRFHLAIDTILGNGGVQAQRA
jgi:hypothetical protein